MPQQNRKHQAFTLIEMLLVLLLLITVILAGRSQYKKYVLRKNIAVVEQNLQLLFDRLDRSFYELSDAEKTICSSRINNSIITDWSQILNSGLISDVTEGTVTHPDFTISCVNPEVGQPAQLVITAPLTVELDQMDWYAQRLHGIRDGNNNIVKWSKVPTYMFAGKDPFWVLGGQLAQFKEKMTISTPFDFIINASVPSIGTTKPVRVVVSYVHAGVNTTVELYTNGNPSPQKKITLISRETSVDHLDISNISIYCLNDGKQIFLFSGVANLPLQINTPLTITSNIFLFGFPPSEQYRASYYDSVGHSDNFTVTGGTYSTWPCS